jgi:hypothetical protein
MKYRQKAGLYEGLQFDGRNHEQVAKFAGDSVITGIAPGASSGERSILVKSGDFYISPDPGWWVMREFTADYIPVVTRVYLFGAGARGRLFLAGDDGLHEVDTSYVFDMVQFTGSNDKDVADLLGEENTDRDGSRFLVRYYDGKWGVMQPGWRAGVAVSDGYRVVVADHSFDRWELAES